MEWHRWSGRLLEVRSYHTISPQYILLCQYLNPHSSQPPHCPDSSPSQFDSRNYTAFVTFAEWTRETSWTAIWNQGTWGGIYQRRRNFLNKPEYSPGMSGTILPLLCWSTTFWLHFQYNCWNGMFYTPLRVKIPIHLRLIYLSLMLKESIVQYSNCICWRDMHKGHNKGSSTSVEPDTAPSDFSANLSERPNISVVTVVDQDASSDAGSSSGASSGGTPTVALSPTPTFYVYFKTRSPRTVCPYSPEDSWGSSNMKI